MYKFFDENIGDQIGFGDSVSQIKNKAYKSNMDEITIPSSHELQNQPFASNLENAKLLTKITKHRINKLELDPRNEEGMEGFLRNDSPDAFND